MENLPGDVYPDIIYYIKNYDTLKVMEDIIGTTIFNGNVWKKLVEINFSISDKSQLKKFWRVNTWRELYEQLYRNKKRIKLIKDNPREFDDVSFPQYFTSSFIDVYIKEGVDIYKKHRDKFISIFEESSIKSVQTRFCYTQITYTDEFEKILSKSSDTKDAVRRLYKWVMGRTYIYDKHGNVFFIPVDEEKYSYLITKINESLYMKEEHLLKYGIEGDIAGDMVGEYNILRLILYKDYLKLYINSSNIDIEGTIEKVYKNRYQSRHRISIERSLLLKLLN